MIGVDWGTTSFRAFRIDAQGEVIDRVDRPLGILLKRARGPSPAVREFVARLQKPLEPGAEPS